MSTEKKIKRLEEEIEALKLKVRAYEGLIKNLVNLNKKFTRELGEFYEFDPHS